MTDTTVLDIAQKALTLVLMVSAPLMGLGLTVGLLVSVFQAATQIHEMTLTFVPKLLAMAAALIAFGPWMLKQCMSFTTTMLQSIPSMVR